MNPAHLSGVKRRNGENQRKSSKGEAAAIVEEARGKNITSSDSTIIIAIIILYDGNNTMIHILDIAIWEDGVWSL
jgi:hypothetical protein